MGEEEKKITSVKRDSSTASKFRVRFEISGGYSATMAALRVVGGERGLRRGLTASLRLLSRVLHNRLRMRPRSSLVPSFGITHRPVE